MGVVTVFLVSSFLCICFRKNKSDGQYYASPPPGPKEETFHFKICSLIVVVAFGFAWSQLKRQGRQYNIQRSEVRPSLKDKGHLDHASLETNLGWSVNPTASGFVTMCMVPAPCGSIVVEL